MRIPSNQMVRSTVAAAVALSLGCYGEMSSLSGSPCESDLDCPGTFSCIVIGVEGTRTCQALVSEGPVQVVDGEKPTPSYEGEVKPLLDAYCNSCHGSVRTASGVQGMRFDQYEDDADGVAGAKNSAVRIRIRMADFRDMPPPSFGMQPTDEEREVLARWEAAGAPQSPVPGTGSGSGGETDADGGVLVGGGTGGGPGAATGNGTGGGTVDAGTVPTGPVSFSKHVQPIFQSYCIGCHTTGNTKGNLNLSAAVARGELLNVPSLCNGSVSLVKAGDSAGSMLWRKIAGDPTRCNGTMPTSNALVNFDPDAVKVIEQWIKEGAQDN